MRILHTVEFYHPSVGGAQEVVRQLSERLRRRGHEVHVATTFLPDRVGESLNGVEVHGFRVSGNEVRGYGGEVESYRKFLLENEFDIVMSYAAQQWSFDIFKELIDKIDSKKVFVPCGYSGLYWSEYESYFEKLPEYLKKFDACVYMAEDYRDVNFAKRHCIGNGVFIPNGAGEEFLAECNGSLRNWLGIGGDEMVFLSVGSYGLAKGQDVVIDAFRRADIGSGFLVFIGNRMPPLYSKFSRTCLLKKLLTRLTNPRKRVIFLDGLDRAQTVAAYREADVFLFGSKIECSPLVLFEACAAGIPFVSTDCGNAGEIARWTNGGVVVSGAKEMAYAIERVATDSDLRRRLGENGREAFISEFNWETITGSYERLYQRLLDD